MTYERPTINDISFEDASTLNMQDAPLSIMMAQRHTGADACGVDASSGAGLSNPFALLGVAAKPSCDGDGSVYPSVAAIGGQTASLKGFNFETTYDCTAT